MSQLITNKLLIFMLVTVIGLALMLTQFPIKSNAFTIVATLSALLLGIMCGYLILNSKIERLHRLANVDEVTGLYNAQAIKKLLTFELERSRRYQRDLSIVLLDVDNFSTLKDDYGQKVVDKTLRNLSDIIMQGVEYINKKKKEFHGIRSSDIAFRYENGGRILILMPETGAKGAYVAAERIREAIMFTPFENVISEKQLLVTLSASVVSFDSESDTTETILKRADLLLRKAKIIKNHVVIENPIHHLSIETDESIDSNVVTFPKA